MQETKKGEIVIYKDNQGPELQVKMDGETVWLNQAQISELFQTARTSITRHIGNIFDSGELVEANSTLKQANVQKMHIGLDKPTIYYNLDVIISVGYRVNSKRATQFRIWATNRLRDYLVKGYSINEKRLKDFENLQIKLKDLEGAHRLIQGALENKKLEGYEKELLRIISDYSSTWFVLNAYDKNDLKIENVTKRSARPLNYEDLQKSISSFKKRLMVKKEASDLFGREVGGKFAGVLGSIYQTFNGEELYPSLEEKAAHLLYFCIKDHPFADGNKRIGALVFLLFLIENSYLMNKKGERKISDAALTALALLIAESKPGDKTALVKLVVNLINKG